MAFKNLDSISIIGILLAFFFSIATSFLIYRADADIIKLQRVEKALRESERLYRSLFDSIDEGFCIIEMIFDENNQPHDYRFLQVNPSFEKQTGLKNAQGKRMLEFAPQHEKHWFKIYGKVALTGEPLRFESRAEELGRWYDVYAFRFGDPENRQVALLFTDITERKRVQDEIQKKSIELKEAHDKLGVIALTDPLTGVYNRRGFETHVQERYKLIKRYKQNAFLLFIDIDKMKWINDTLGHKEGDVVLVEVANILKDCCRDMDLIARLGGDEFSIFLTLTNVGDENVIIERSQRHVDQRMLYVNCHIIHFL